MTNHHVIRTDKVVADVYAGEKLDKVEKHFETYCDGDMDSDRHQEDIVFSLKDLPPGAIISVQYPCCPECGVAREDEYKTNPGCAMEIIGHASKCQCDFDWENWVQEEFS